MTEEFVQAVLADIWDNRTALGREGNFRSYLYTSVRNRLLYYQARYQQDTYTASEMMSTLQDMVWAELDSHEPISMYRRNLQRAYLQAMKALLQKEVSDIRSLARAHLTQLLKEVKQYDSSDPDNTKSSGSGSGSDRDDA